jgi:hypothetical protein
MKQRGSDRRVMVRPMNNVNFGSGGLLVVFLLAAAAILAFGVWHGRRDLGVRGAQGVLAASLLPVLLPPALGFAWLGLTRSPLSGVVALVLLQAILLALSFLPLLVAVNWMQIIREDTAMVRGDGPLGTGRESA